MVAKKKSVKTTEVAEEKEAERRPPVTQVVEVVEEEQEQVVTPQKEVSEPGETLESEVSSEDEKRRVLVDELFQKKTDPSPVMAPEISVHQKPSRRPIFMWAMTIVIICLLAGGAMFAVSSGAVSLPSIMTSPTPTPTPTATPTPTPDVSALDRSSLSIQVLNGSGIPGVAGTMKDLLEEKGYTVDNTGNAETYDYETTLILVKAESEAYIALLEEDLKESYSLGTSKATLEDDVPYDVRIIVGKE